MKGGAVMSKEPKAEEKNNQQPGETHYRFIMRVVAKGDPRNITCSAGHLTFGGRCMNCGYDPAKSGLGILEG